VQWDIYNPTHLPWDRPIDDFGYSILRISIKAFVKGMKIIRYNTVIKAIFLSRPNRFIAHCALADGTEVVSHVRNTGRCKELLLPGVTVYLEHSPSPSRKTVYSLVAVEKGERLINMDSQIPNGVAEEGIERGIITFPEVGRITGIRREVTYGNSRIDLLVEGEQAKALVEVKGVTLEQANVALFPDAPTQRGIKHIQELQGALRDGYLCYILFIIQMGGRLEYFTPNDNTHPEFRQTLQEAVKAGVKALAYDCEVTPGSITAARPVPVRV